VTLLKSIQGNGNIQTIKKLFVLENPALNEILLSVQPVDYGRYGVYADAVLIAILPDHFLQCASANRYWREWHPARAGKSADSTFYR
jgi:hypothetical protein